MRKTIAIGIPTIVILLAGMLACDNSTPVAPEGSTIILSASPRDILNVDPNTQEGESRLQAVVLNASGIPQDGVAVFFSTTAGRLDSAGVSVPTDGNGIARDRLTTSISAQVTAQSGTASQQVTITISGQVIVQDVNLQILGGEPTNGQAPLTREFQVSVTDTNGQPVKNIIVNVVTTPPFPITPNPDYLVGGQLRTDTGGVARFEIVNLGEDTTVTASAGGVQSQTINLTIDPP
ncbi:MAG: hypothetical protein PVF68_09210 [Acidobacteriota bacterium]|jgi:hypothetical protein